MRFITRGTAVLIAGVVTSLTLAAPQAGATPPTVVKFADVGSKSFNPPELTCSDLGYTWGILSTITATAGVAIVHPMNDGSIVFQFTGFTRVRIEAANSIDEPLGGPAFEVQLAGLTKFKVVPGSNELTVDFAGKSLLGAAYVSGKASVTFGEFGLKDFYVSPNTVRLCEQLAL